jgi:hypothetical protein
MRSPGRFFVVPFLFLASVFVISASAGHAIASENMTPVLLAVQDARCLLWAPMGKFTLSTSWG